MTVMVKICGVTRPEDAAAVADAGADFVGLNFWPGSKRHVGMALARDLAAAARTARPTNTVIRIVGVFVDAAVDEIEAIAVAVGLDGVQLHGDERPEDCARVFQRTGLPVWKAVPLSGIVADLSVWPVAAILLDGVSPGSGQTIDWTVAAELARGAQPPRRAGEGPATQEPGAPFASRPIVLAGGLHPGNVAEAVRTVRPWGVDVASGVEAAPGIKDAEKIARFVEEARKA